MEPVLLKVDLFYTLCKQLNFQAKALVLLSRKTQQSKPTFSFTALVESQTSRACKTPHLLGSMTQIRLQTSKLTSHQQLTKNNECELGNPSSFHSHFLLFIFLLIVSYCMMAVLSKEDL